MGVRIVSAAILCAVAAIPFCRAQDLHLRIEYSGNAKSPLPPAVVWLKPLDPGAAAPFTHHKTYTLLQKNRSFIPHLLVIPVGTQVQFPNEDPFYHNVFSLFDGKRFDLGLYEAGSSKSVTFSREGVSYIFCNIHPEMSAVVIALSTPLYATAEANGSAEIRGTAAGDYELHVWAEGVSQPDLDRLTRRVHVTPNQSELGVITLPFMPKRAATHLNKFGQPYDKQSSTTY